MRLAIVCLALGACSIQTLVLGPGPGDLLPGDKDNTLAIEGIAQSPGTLRLSGAHLDRAAAVTLETLEGDVTKLVFSLDGDALQVVFDPGSAAVGEVHHLTISDTGGITTRVAIRLAAGDKGAKGSTGAAGPTGQAPLGHSAVISCPTKQMVTAIDPVTGAATCGGWDGKRNETVHRVRFVHPYEFINGGGGTAMDLAATAVRRFGTTDTMIADLLLPVGAVLERVDCQVTRNGPHGIDVSLNRYTIGASSPGPRKDCPSLSPASNAPGVQTISLTSFGNCAAAIGGAASDIIFLRLFEEVNDGSNDIALHGCSVRYALAIGRNGLP